MSHNWTGCQSQSHIATDGQSVSLGVDPHMGLITRYLLLFDSYGLVFCGTPSLTRGRVCISYMLLTLASVVFLESESLGTGDHIVTRRLKVGFCDVRCYATTFQSSQCIRCGRCYSTDKTPIVRQRLLKDHCRATLGKQCLKAGILKSIA
jgi:hypothetical protein